MCPLAYLSFFIYHQHPFLCHFALDTVLFLIHGSIDLLDVAQPNGLLCVSSLCRMFKIPRESHTHLPKIIDGNTAMC